MQFKDIIGQDSVKDHLRRMYDTRRMSHATLLAGPEGSGALPLAIAYAQYINCTGDKSNGDSCGICPSCVKYKKLAHPDLHFIYPTISRGDSTSSDTYLTEWRQMFDNSIYFDSGQWTTMMGGAKQAIINKNDALAIHQKLSLQPFEAEYQVLIMWRPELMNEASANKILKILEEPPRKTLFILVSEHPTEILPTILSRAQMLKVSPVDESNIKKHLMVRYNMNEADSSRLAHISNGNIITMLKLIGQMNENNANLTTFMSVMRTCYTRNVIEMRKLSEQIGKAMSRDQLKDFLKYSIHMVRENFMLNLAEPQLVYMTPDEENFSQKFSRFIHVGNVFQMVDLFDEAISQIEQNGNAHIILLDMFLQLTILLKIARPE